MSELKFSRLTHQQVHALLMHLDSHYLSNTRCFFGGGTRIVLELGEYRESRDVGFLCADRAGYRKLRETISSNSLGAIQIKKLTLLRDVRADQYGIRTFVELGESRLKLEIVREARIDLDSETVKGLPVACLSKGSCFAEKLLANADRGLDTSTLSRDIVDLAFMIEAWPEADLQTGLATAAMAYGDAVARSLKAVGEKIRKDKVYRYRCIDGLGITDSKTLSSGIKALMRLVTA